MGKKIFHFGIWEPGKEFCAISHIKMAFKIMKNLNLICIKSENINL